MSYIFYWPCGRLFIVTESVLLWIKENCPSYITNDVCRDTNCYRFYFSDEKDYILTVLRWS
jgi:hypothetical protein